MATRRQGTADQMETKRPKRSSGTERRQRTELVALRLLPEERRQLILAAEARGMSVSTLLRECITDVIAADAAEDGAGAPSASDR